MILRFALAFLVLTLARAADSAAPAWRAGTAVAVVTPKANMWMGGYAAREHPSTGKVQDLRAKALAIVDTDGHRMVFLTVDAIAVPRIVRKNLEKRLAATHQLQPAEFVITASHTHSGPEFRAGRVPDPAAEGASTEYIAFFEETLFRLAGEALANLTPARLAYVHARAGFAMNRRLPQASDGPTNAPFSDGPVDHDVPVLRVEDAQGKLRAVLFGYACHNTTLTQTSYVYCADYAGFAQQYLEADHPGILALFMTGCAGDQNPYPRSTLPLAQAHGRTLATAVEAALITKPRALAGPLRSTYAETDLRYAATPDRAEFERRLSSKIPQEADHAKRMLARLDREGSLPKSYPYPMQVVHFGSDLTLVALGGEAVVDYSLRLKRELGGGPAAVWVAAYSNDVMAYIATERVLREGGYEGFSAMRIGSLHPSPWAPGLEDQIVGKVRELDRSLSAPVKVTARE